MRKIIVCLILLPLTCLYSQQTYMRVSLKGGSTSSFPIQDMKITIKLTFTGVGDEQKYHSVLRAFKLLQNFPNPFNPTTTIKYEIPKAGMVDVQLYDINGRLIRTLLSEHQEFGAHSLRWDSRNDVGTMVSSGVYFYQVRFDQTVLSRKMLLLK